MLASEILTVGFIVTMSKLNDIAEKIMLKHPCLTLMGPLSMVILPSNLAV